MNQKIVAGLLSILFLCGGVHGAAPVCIDFFYELGCRDCERIETELLPEIAKRFQGDCIVRSHDIGIKTNFLHLLQLEHDLGYTAPERAYLIFNKQVVFGARPELGELVERMTWLLKQEAISQPAAQAVPDLAEEHFRDFTFPAVITAGLMDGINPCAFSTLVFFMSLLTVAKVRKRELILLGISFCLASFMTYLSLGFGLFRILHLFSGFTALRKTVEWILMAVLLILSGLSFRDAFRFWRTGRTGDVLLQLSTGMKKRIHGVMRRGLGSTSIFLGGLLIGVAVTAIESVCTGQIYVPTLVLILKDSAFSESRAWLYLLVYNLMFVLPLVIVFIAVYFGLKTDILLVLSRRNVVVSKTLMGLLFILLVLLILRF